MRRGQVPTLCANPHEQICSLASAGEEGFNSTVLVLVLVRRTPSLSHTMCVRHQLVVCVWLFGIMDALLVSFRCFGCWPAQVCPVSAFFRHQESCYVAVCQCYGVLRALVCTVTGCYGGTVNPCACAVEGMCGLQRHVWRCERHVGMCT
jgi:hypothetical protein